MSEHGKVFAIIEDKDGKFSLFGLHPQKSKKLIAELNATRMQPVMTEKDICGQEQSKTFEIKVQKQKSC